jgi:hypothetical protein
MSHARLDDQCARPESSVGSMNDVAAASLIDWDNRASFCGGGSIRMSLHDLGRTSSETRVDSEQYGWIHRPEILVERLISSHCLSRTVEVLFMSF